jgi:serine/threonine protein kinase
MLFGAINHQCQHAVSLQQHPTPPRANYATLACRSDFQKIVAKIMALDYSIPEKLQLSSSVKDLLSLIFVKDPEKRITIAQIKAHEWYLHRLPFELCEGYQGFERCPFRSHSELTTP